MAMIATDCLTPSGRLNGAALWPKGGRTNPKGYNESEVGETLSAYLQEGYAKAEVVALAAADQDEPARLWAYYRAYQEAYERLLLMPSSVSVSDQGSSGYTQAQIELVGSLASGALAEFTDLLEELGTIEEAGYTVITSLR